MAKILAASAQMLNLRYLDLGGANFTSPKPKQAVQSSVSVELVKLLNDDEKPLENLLLCNCKMGNELTAVINTLGVCAHLTHLDIAGNGIKDFGARLLAKVRENLCNYIKERGQGY